jgi:hypothetical protein
VRNKADGLEHGLISLFEDQPLCDRLAQTRQEMVQGVDAMVEFVGAQHQVTRSHPQAASLAQNALLSDQCLHRSRNVFRGPSRQAGVQLLHAGLVLGDQALHLAYQPHLRFSREEVALQLASERAHVACGLPQPRPDRGLGETLAT